MHSMKNLVGMNNKFILPINAQGFHFFFMAYVGDIT